MFDGTGPYPPENRREDPAGILSRRIPWGAYHLVQNGTAFSRNLPVITQRDRRKQRGVPHPLVLVTNLVMIAPIIVASTNVQCPCVAPLKSENLSK